MEYILDTNVYRELVYNLSISEIPNIVNKLIEWENKTQSYSGLSIVVSMELIQHLTTNDPAKENCFKALCLQMLHTKKKNYSNQVIEVKFYPPLNEIIVDFNFERHSKYFQCYLNVLDFIQRLTNELDINICLTYENEILAVKKQVEFDKAEIKNNIENYLRSINGGTLDWEQIKNSKDDTSFFFKNATVDDKIKLLGRSLIKRAYQIVDLNPTSEQVEERLSAFITAFRPALLMNVLILDKVQHGVKKMTSITHKRWHTINDVQIMFALLYNSNEKMLVTEDGDIINSCINDGLSDKVLKSKDYFKLIGI